MKIILTESQLRKILNEQMGHKSFMGPNHAHYKNNPSGFVSDTQKWMDGIVDTAEDPVFWEIMGIALAFVPYIGIPLAMGAELNAARLYKEKGDNFNATVTGILALLPLVGKIPGVKQVTSSFIRGIKESIKTGVELTSNQLKYIKTLIDNKVIIQKEIKKINSIVKSGDKAAIQKLKTNLYHGSPHYFKKFNPSKIGTGADAGEQSLGMFFSNDPYVAKYFSKETGSFLGNLKKLIGIGGYKSTIFKGVVKPKNPKVVDFFGSSSGGVLDKNKIILQAWEDGHDAVILKNIVDGPPGASNVTVVNPDFIESTVKSFKPITN
jgi:hypothetical protein